MSTAGLTPEQLKEILASVIAEARKPAPLTQKEQTEQFMAQQFRKDQAEQVLEGLAQKKAFQQMCSHEHTKREGGGTHCVWVRDDPAYNSSGYIYCQKCEGRVRPDDPNMKRLDPGARFDTALFNKLFQDCNEGELLG